MPNKKIDYTGSTKNERAISKPYIIEFPKIGNSNLGYISVAENDNIPFKIKRVYWTYFTPDDVIRGGHAHYELQQVLIAVSGKIIIKIEMPGEMEKEFILDSPNYGLYLPKLAWGTMKYTHNTVQMCLANLPYNESDYIRNYSEFVKIV